MTPRVLLRKIGLAGVQDALNRHQSVSLVTAGALQQLCGVPNMP